MALLKQTSLVRERVERWIKDNRSGILDPRLLGPKSHDVDDALALAMAISDLVESGKLLRVYKVVTPTGEISKAEFNNPREIPDKLLDADQRWFDTACADIIPVFRAK